MSSFLNLKISAVAYGGYGIGRHDDLVVFVPFAIPGDEILVDIVKRKKRFAFGTIREFLKESEQRIKPKCEHFADCGGCHFQNASYENELKWKMDCFKDTIKRLSGQGAADIPQLLILPDTKRDEYRFKAKFHLNDQLELGFYSRKTKDLIALSDCQICTAPIRAFVKKQSQHKYTSILNTHFKKLREIQLKEANGTLHCLVVADYFIGDIEKLKKESVLLGINSLAHIKSLEKVREKSRQLFGEKSILLKLGDYKYLTGTTSFFQNNLRQALKLNLELIAICKNIKGQRLLDLYCGAGFFSIPIAGFFDRVLGVDSNYEAITYAKQSAVLNEQNNLQFLGNKAKNIFNDKFYINYKPDTIVVDPPRGGLEPLFFDFLKKVKSRIVIYISCSPPTLARDIKGFISLGYKWQSCKLIDMFPNTYHTESVSVFKFSN
ncbi:MAG: 23S rRNA (uracil(1939)-C(5))-methyltransferase RlmD [Pseudomonadota bacterium]